MKKLLYVIVGLIVVYLILCMAGPARVHAERSITINAPAGMIKSKLADLKLFHDAWSPWTEKDPDMKTTYTGEMGQPGSTMSWESDKKEVGKGTMTYLNTVGDTVLCKLVFDGRGESKVYFLTTPDGSGTKVTWAMDMRIGFLGRGPVLFMNMDKMIGPDFEKGLSKLKPVVEASAEVPAAKLEVKEISWGEKTYIGKKETISFDKLKMFFAENLPKIHESIVKDGLEMASPPSGIFYTFDETKKETECAAVIGVVSAKNAKGWEKFTIPPSKVLQVAYYGPYENIMAAHNVLMTYMKEKGLTQAMCIEEYVTDPMEEKDSNKWLTNVYYILK